MVAIARARIARTLAAALLLSACAPSEPAALLVDLRTDLGPESEFWTVRTEVVEGPASGRFVRHEVDPAADYLSGVRVAELDGLTSGPVTLRVQLLLPDGGVVAERPVIATLGSSITAVTVVVTRDCAGTACPRDGDDPSATACLAAACVRPECLGGDTDACDLPRCTSASDCAAAAACAQPRCAQGVCLYASDGMTCSGVEACDPNEGCIPTARILELDDTGCDDDPLSGALFCDGFEDPSLAAWPRYFQTNGRAGRTTERVFRGVGALRAECTAAAPCTATAVLTLPEPITEGELHWRGWVYLPSDAPTDLTFLTFNEAMEPWGGANPVIEADDHLSLWLSETTTYYATPTLRRDAWTCIGARVVIDDVDGTIELSLNGVPILSRTGIDTLPASGYANFNVGIGYAAASDGAVLYFDEVAVSRGPLPCDS